MDELRERMNNIKKNKVSLEEWYDIVQPILLSNEYQNKKKYRHHGDTSVYDHCVNVSIKA